MNGIAIHPYPVTDGSHGTAPHYDPAVMEQVLNRIRAVRAANHDASTPLWITETGVPTQSILGLAPATTDEQQGAYLSTMVNQIKHDRDVKVAIIDRLIDPPLDLGAAYDALAIGFGVFNSDGTPNPRSVRLSREFGGNLNC
jgi:exo-beta-1,3-glucanase (GH17 family)